jgi:hypothetical protein
VVLVAGQSYFLCPKERGLLAGLPECRVRVTSARTEPMRVASLVREPVADRLTAPVLLIDRITRRAVADPR